MLEETTVFKNINGVKELNVREFVLVADDVNMHRIYDILKSRKFFAFSIAFDGANTREYLLFMWERDHSSTATIQIWICSRVQFLLGIQGLPTQRS